MTDRVAVFNDISTLFCILNQYLVACRGVLIDSNLHSINLDNISLLFGLKAHNNRVSRINF